MKRILLIEDDALMAELQARLLTSAGLEVVTAPTLPEARARLESQPFDLILSDLQLVEGTAEQTIDFLKPHAEALPIVICSGHYATERGQSLRAACMAAGFLDYIDKFERSTARIPVADRLKAAYEKFHSS